MGRVWRFLLDQNFPPPVLDVEAVDKRVEYEHLRTFDPSLTRGGTPDWLIYLRAAESARFDGVVTRDVSQLEQPEELAALVDTTLTVVTWRQPVEDPIQEWGQLLAYMPHIIRRMELVESKAIGGKRAHAFFLPRPQLGRDNVKPVHALMGERANREKRSLPDVRAAARAEMKLELRRRGLSRLERLLEPPPKIGPPSAKPT